MCQTQAHSTYFQFSVVDYERRWKRRSCTAAAGCRRSTPTAGARKSEEVPSDHSAQFRLVSAPPAQAQMSFNQKTGLVAIDQAVGGYLKDLSLVLVRQHQVRFTPTEFFSLSLSSLLQEFRGTETNVSERWQRQLAWQRA